MNLKLRLIAALFLIFSFSQKDDLFAQAIEVTLITGENMSSLYQLDTSGLGENIVVTNDINSIGSIRFIIFLDNYQFNYVSRDGVGEFCCLNVNLTGDQGSRDYQFTFKVIQPVLPTSSFIEKYIWKDSSEILQIPILDPADTVFTDLAAVDSIANFRNFGNVNLEFLGSNGIYAFFELSGKQHGLEVNRIQLCKVDGSQCESYSLTTWVMDTSLVNLPAQVNINGNFCDRGRASFCSGIARSDYNFTGLELEIDGEPFPYFRDSCGITPAGVSYNLGIPFLRPPNRFRIESWTVDGTVYSRPSVGSFDEMILFLNKHFPGQRWEQRGGRIQGVKDDLSA